ncbi:DUF1989 domain-containing protein [Henriciella algicola]|uniref:Urea carboxylase-associated family protein n=1 Tax=Henriciella algicola TaxID=1608422 RepID=A0A399RIJ4_9PROT|nr:urea carboxylase-associated family protein [Henriciella algicola]RIJ31098.1 urea carboxylase-associated family protein [Henriciella algicola]
MTVRIPPRSGKGFRLNKGEILKVTDPQGEQVSDMVAFNAADTKEYISSGRSIDYASKMFLSTGDILYSNRSNPMFEIISDDVKRHDFTLTPCSREMFRKLYGETNPPPGCQGNLEMALQPYGIAPDQVPIAFNIFMHVAVNGETGEIEVRPPLSKAGDSIKLRAEMDMIVALTACSAGQSNNHTYKPIDFELLPEGAADG